MGLPQPSTPPPAWGRLGQGLFIDTVPSSLPLPEETALGGDGPDLAVLVDIPPGPCCLGTGARRAFPLRRGVQGRDTPTHQPGGVPEGGEFGGSMVAVGQPGCSPFLALVTSGWAASGSVPLLRALPVSLMGGSCFSQCR